jgi:hypothetical protein
MRGVLTQFEVASNLLRCNESFIGCPTKLQLKAWRDVFTIRRSDNVVARYSIMVTGDINVTLRIQTKNIRHVTKIVYPDHHALNIEYRHYLCSANN